MSKIIRITPEYIEECRREFEEALAKSKVSDGKFSFNKTFSIEKQSATVYFTAMAWSKMVALIQQFDKEIAWHGSAKRLEGEENAYLIDDIMVYPQTVTGASVDMDPTEYDKWIRENGEDERFFRINMQGHSHVRMGVTPSGVDLAHQEEILSQLPADSFYIFMIYNKMFESNIKIYDLAKNVLFENGEVTTKLYDSDFSLEEFIKEARSMVVTKSYIATPASVKPAAQGYSGGYKPLDDKYKPASAKQEFLPPKTEKHSDWPYRSKNTYYDFKYGGYYDPDDPTGAFDDGRSYK